MDQVRNFKDLRVWQLGMEIVKQVYLVSRKFPKSEMFGLAGQMQRAAVSIPSNIAEGHNRPQRRYFQQFISISLGSCAELETQILIAKELNYLNENESDSLFKMLDNEGRQLRSLAVKLAKK